MAPPNASLSHAAISPKSAAKKPFSAARHQWIRRTRRYNKAASAALTASQSAALCPYGFRIAERFIESVSPAASARNRCISLSIRAKRAPSSGVTADTRRRSDNPA